MTERGMPPIHNTPEGHPEGEYDFWHDLNPDFLAGENYGTLGPQPGKDSPSAYDVKAIHDRLTGFNDEDLKRIPVIAPGSRLQQGAVYLDLAQPSPQEFTATGDMEARRSNLFIPKAETPYWLWNRLIGVQNPERLDAASER